MSRNRDCSDRRGDVGLRFGAARLGRLLGAVAVGCLVAAWAVPGAAGAERWSRSGDAVFQNLGPDNGQPQPIASSLEIATALEEDGDGFLWVGTQGGLARWDGYRFRGYLRDPADPGALQDNFINCLHTDPSGRLWIGTSAGGLARYDRDHDRFITLGAGPNGLSHVRVWAIADDGAGGLWIGTDGGLDRLDPDTGAITRLRHDDSDRGSLPNDHIYALLRDHAGVLWVGTKSGIVRRDAGAGPFVAVPLPTPKGPTPDISTVFEDSAGRKWIGTSTAGAYAIEPGDAVAHPVHETDRGDAPADAAWIQAIAEAAPGEIWLGTYGQGIVTVDTAGWRTHRIRHDPARPTSLAHDTVWALHRDRAGLIWAGTFGGISRGDPGQAAVKTLFGGKGRDNAISEADIRSVLAAPDGRVWLGLNDDGVDILDPAQGVVTALRSDPTQAETALPQAPVLALARSTGGDIYLGTYRGLYRADSAGRRVNHLALSKEQAPLSVRELFSDAAGLWVGTLSGQLWKLDPGTGEVTRHYTLDQLTDQNITSVLPASDGRLWIGTRNGLNRLDTATEKIERIPPDPKDPRSLSAGFVSSLLTDRRGRLWVATQGGGIDVLEPRDGETRPGFRRLGIAQGLPNDNVDKLLTDATGRIWASTDNGLAVIDPDSFAVRALHRAEGVVISGYWVNSGDATPQGELLFGGLGGLTVVRPDRLAAWSYGAPLVVTDLRAGGKPVPAGRFNGAGTHDPLVIPPETNSLAVEFAALDYSAPERNLYAYRLDGFDRDWVDTDSTRRLAAYTNLPPGDYTLRLRGSNREGVWTETSLSVPIRVLPGWHQTWWFRGAVGLAALAAMAAVVQARTAYLRQQQSVLERRVTERTAALQQRTDELAEAQRRLEEIAYYDALTSLPNRRLFTEEFRRMIAQARRRRERFALLLLDLDRFKLVNDTLGHDAGDALLVAAAGHFREAVRESDFVARLGGDEFAILLLDSYLPEAIEPVCRRIVDSFVEPIPFNGQPMKTSPSIGIALYPDHGESQERLFKSADLALYAAKRAGRNTWRWHDADQQG